ncbi:AI-2E family transporter [Paenibacillus sp. IB182496]|uniref:AI-2E family transporter n=1 Tax=Paenibacillus sabuli TaxID=2772509 RepID=A0A927BZ74_9BACL|nr:AI-2E family transporter [Paenibacillus sabuli]MBD2848003.1 AI-2E family transporter [Paenibacillus sabuli]
MEKKQPATGMDRFKRFILNNKFVLFLFVLMLVGLNIMILTKISFIFKPFVVLVKTVLLPLILAGIAYYLLNPLVNWLERKKIKRLYSIFVIFLLIAGLLTILLFTVIPLIDKQIRDLIDNLPTYGEQIQEEFNLFMSSGLMSQAQNWLSIEPSDLTSDITSRATAFLDDAWSSLGSFVGALKEVVLAIITLPFILYYLLKDGKRMPRYIASGLPTRMRSHSLRIMREINTQISGYIRGQIIVSCCIGLLLYIGYLIIGLKYSLVLALIAACTAIIPYLGPAIAITPALIVAMVTSPIMLIKMIVIWTIVQLIEGKFISPQIMGKTLQVHPITIIFVIITAGNLFGVLGIILAVPGYAVLKVIVTNLFIWVRRKSSLYEDRAKIRPSATTGGETEI